MIDDREALKRLIKRISDEIQDSGSGHLITAINVIRIQLKEMEKEHGKET
tara:strand:- start:1292 stop:1441 length:150 start_codon:yes stop_codon:yes gene_type:complete